MSDTMQRNDIDRMLKQVMLKDMRVNCRLRGLSPAGGKEQLSDRLAENMMETRNFALKTEDGTDVQVLTDFNAGLSTNEMDKGHGQNNYNRPSGQNVGNFLTDRASSRVLAPPGGGSSICFGDDTPAGYVAPAQAQQAAPAAPAQHGAGSLANIGQNPDGHKENNYSRPAGQNVGNFLTDRHMVKLHGPPGGVSQIQFG